MLHAYSIFFCHKYIIPYVLLFSDILPPPHNIPVLIKKGGISIIPLSDLPKLLKGNPEAIKTNNC
jgi:hypothetical protein